MMKVRDIQVFLSQRMGRQMGEIDQRIRPLRGAGALEFGPRGDAAPALKPAELCYILAAMASRRAADSLAPASRFMSDCRYVEHPRHAELVDYKLPHGTQAGVFLMLLLTHPEAFDADCFEISDDGAYAWFTFWKGGVLQRLFFSADADEARDLVAGDERVYLRQGAHSVGSRFSIGGGALAELAMKLAAPDAKSAAPRAAAAMVEA